MRVYIIPTREHRYATKLVFETSVVTTQTSKMGRHRRICWAYAKMGKELVFLISKNAQFTNDSHITVSYNKLISSSANLNSTL